MLLGLREDHVLFILRLFHGARRENAVLEIIARKDPTARVQPW
jgi:hypothetical protein